MAIKTPVIVKTNTKTNTKVVSLVGASIVTATVGGATNTPALTATNTLAITSVVDKVGSIVG